MYKKPTLESVVSVLDEHEERLSKMEKTVDDIAEIKIGVIKVVRYLKYGLPSIISAAVAAGLVNDKIGNFLQSLFST